MIEPRPFHRLFGLSWIDFFEGTSVKVETEIDLSIKLQFLDVVLISTGTEPIPRELPDGFDQLAKHNLITFKSHHEALDAWAIFELLGHFVNYRKQSGPSLHDMLPEADYELFAVCTRFPNNLAQHGEMRPIREGVFDIIFLGRRIRVIVIHQLPAADRNAMLLLFSAREELLRFGQEHYRQHSPETSTLLNELLRFYLEDPNMSEKLKEFARESIDKLLKSLTPEKRMEGLSTDERLKGLPSEELARRLPTEERLKGLPAEERLKGLPAEEILRALSPEVLEAARKLKSNGSSQTH